MQSRPTAMKRARERARAEKQKAKVARRMERAQTAEPRQRGGDLDPDIAHIQAGPQPQADWQVDEDTKEETDDTAENAG